MKVSEVLNSLNIKVSEIGWKACRMNERTGANGFGLTIRYTQKVYDEDGEHTKTVNTWEVLAQVLKDNGVVCNIPLLGVKYISKWHRFCSVYQDILENNNPKAKFNTSLDSGKLAKYMELVYGKEDAILLKLVEDAMPKPADK